MKTAQNQAAQGDVLFTRVGALPAGVTKAAPTNGKHVVAHSETGHHHTVEPASAELWSDPTDPMTCYLQLTATECLITHHRDYDTHEALALLGDPGTVWEVRRQEEWTPEGWRQVQD